MKPIYHRSLDKFKGSTAVIGCGHDGVNPSCNNKPSLHPNKEDFYTLDIANPNADCVVDITEPSPDLPRQRFQFTVLEYLDSHAYNDDSPMNYRHLLPEKNYGTKGRQGFLNILDLSTKDGYILIVGCPRIKDYRQSITMHHLNYIELDPGESSECLLIPKNQAATVEEIRLQMARLPEKLQKMMQDAVSLRSDAPLIIDKLIFCGEEYEKMPTLREDTLKRSKFFGEQHVSSIAKENQYFLESIKSGKEVKLEAGNDMKTEYK